MFSDLHLPLKLNDRSLCQTHNASLRLRQSIYRPLNTIMHHFAAASLCTSLLISHCIIISVSTSFLFSHCISPCIIISVVIISVLGYSIFTISSTIMHHCAAASLCTSSMHHCVATSLCTSFLTLRCYMVVTKHIVV